MSKRRSNEQIEALIADLGKVMPQVLEMRALYNKWRMYYKALGKSDRSSHKMASQICIRDFPNFNAEAEKLGLFK